MWGTLFAFVFMISVAMGLAAIRLSLWHKQIVRRACASELSAKSQ